MFRALVVGNDRSWVTEVEEILSASVDSGLLVQTILMDELERFGVKCDVMIVQYGPDVSRVLRVAHALDPMIDIVVCEVPERPATIVSLFRDGATGFVHSSDDPCRLRQILRHLADGTIILNRDVVAYLVQTMLFSAGSNMGRSWSL